MIVTKHSEADRRPPTQFARVARLVAAALSVGLAGTAYAGSRVPAAPLTNVGITAGIPPTTVLQPGASYFTAVFHLNYAGGPLLLSSTADGTGSTAVDDVITIRVRRPDGSFAKFSYDYSNDCAGYVSYVDPMDLSQYFQPGDNLVTVTLADKCGSIVRSEPLWLVQPQ